MNRKLRYITQKIDAVQSGLLRYHDKKVRITLHVTVKTRENTLICIADHNADIKNLVNKKVSLIQKSEDDYLYISGTIQEKSDSNKKAIFISIIKACWFVRQSRGSLSWLQEKHIYDTSLQDDPELSSLIITGQS
jgi:hypothetical protein